MARVADLPASNLLRFFLSYGPDESNTNLFDEKVAQNMLRFGIQPIDLRVKNIKEIENLLVGEEPASVLIAGVAGDGKSYHLRQVWKDLGGDVNLWQENGDKTLTVQIPGKVQRDIVFIKDLSAGLSNFVNLWDTVLKKQSTQPNSIIMACNQGQILTRLRALGDQEANQFANQLEDTFFGTDSKRVVNGIHVFDLSRVSQSDRLKEIIQHIVMHSGWQVCNQVDKECPLFKHCFIQQNLDLLWDRVNDKPTVITKRLCQLVELAGFNGTHFPMRELLMLVENALFGLKNPPSGKLGNCHFVQSKYRDQKSVRGTKMDLFTNLLGDNLSKSLREKKELFKNLANFEVGSFGHPYFDKLILLGNENPDVTVRNIYQKYLGKLPLPPSIEDGLSAEKVAAERAKWLQEARLRLFFCWDEKDNQGKIIHENELWTMTAYPHAADYLKLREESIKYSDEQDIPPQLITGLNRIMTGSASVMDESVIRLATNGADTQDPVGLMVVGQISAGMIFQAAQATMVFNSTGADAVPVLKFQILPNEEEAIHFNLTPRRYEFLVNLDEGTLPTSFSKQCQSEFYALKSLLVRAVYELQKYQKRRMNGIRVHFIDDRSPITIKLPVRENDE